MWICSATEGQIASDYLSCDDREEVKCLWTEFIRMEMLEMFNMTEMKMFIMMEMKIDVHHDGD